MRKLLSMLTAVFLLMAGTAWANNCPNLMKEIDAKLATKPALSKDVSDKVVKLRADGETAHKAGKHAESEKALGEARNCSASNPLTPAARGAGRRQVTIAAPRCASSSRSTERWQRFSSSQ